MNELETISSTPDSLFDYWRPRVGFWLGPVLGLAGFFLVDGHASLSPQAQKLFGILLFTFTYWVCEPIPLAATSLLSPLLCVIFGVEDLRKALQPFASPIVFLFIGSFTLAEATHKHGLDQRLALNVLSRPGVARSPTTMLMAIGLVTGFLSMWMSNTATTALVLPVVLGVLRTHPQLASPRVAPSLLLMISFAATAGGLATPVGTPPNLIAMGFVEQLVGGHVSFARWMVLGVPLFVVLLGVLVLLLRPRGVGTLENHHEFVAGLRAQARALGPLSRGERNVVLVFVFALGCWLYPGVAEMIGGKAAPGVKWFNTHLTDDLVGLAAGLMLFLLPINLKKWEFTVTWQDAARIDWGTILLFGGGMAMGYLIFSTGLAKAVADVLMGWVGAPGLWTLILVAVVSSIALSEFASNTASANVTVPLVIGLAQASHINAVPVAVAACLACSFGFMLPVSTPPNAIVYGSGLVPLRRMLVAGTVFDCIGVVAILLAMWVAVATGLW